MPLPEDSRLVEMSAKFLSSLNLPILDLILKDIDSDDASKILDFIFGRKYDLLPEEERETWHKATKHKAFSSKNS